MASAPDVTRAGPAKPRRRRAGRALVVLLTVVLGLGLVGALLAFRPFSTPSSSMAPTLVTGDYFYVSKLAYGLSRHALPASDLLPFRIDGRLGARDPQRGDVVVFKARDGRTDYVKRVIGLPGDTVRVLGGLLLINGKVVERERIENFEIKDYSGTSQKVAQYVERLPGGVSHRIIETQFDAGFFDDTPRYEVPNGHVFVLGDNRDNSVDSRDQNSIGFVPLDHLVGRAAIIYLSVGEDGSGLRAERMFTKID